jgi:lactoylglutathione lyase
MDEIVLLYPDGGSSLVLMHWTDGSTRDYSNNPVKIVVRLEDPKAAARRIREAGYSIIREPEPAPEVGGFIVGFAKDPDGYLVELLDARQS